MFIVNFIALLTAISISSVAAYYSIIGLATIFSGSFLPVIIMGAVLEVGKIVTTVWLHTFWDKLKWFIKAYMTFAVIVLMFITSMGIFGFLSKAHIEQTSAGLQNVAKIDRLKQDISRLETVVKKAEAEIKKLETSGSGADASAQKQIDLEQKRIDSLYARIKPTIDDQNKIIEQANKLYVDQLNKVTNDLKMLQQFIDAGEIAKAQAMVGASADGKFGRNTAKKFNDFKDARTKERDSLVKKIEDNPNVKAARAEIARVRKTVEDEVKKSNEVINRLRSQIGKNVRGNIDQLIDEQNKRIKTSNTEINKLTDDKFKLESEYRKIEAEVGPVKYIAQLIYGDNIDRNLLEKAVRWVTIIIVAVFDPLAVCMILGVTVVINSSRKRKDELDDLIDPVGEDQIDRSVEPKIVIEKIQEEVDTSTPDDIKQMEEKLKDKLT